MKGVIEQIWDNTSKTGKPYKAIQIGGERYTLWDKKYFDAIQKGESVDFEFDDKGKFKNITSVQLANNGRGYEAPFSQHYFSIKAMLEAGLKFRNNITWDQLHRDNDTAWDSWCSPSSPRLRYQTAAIIVGFKGEWKLKKIST